MGTGHHTGMGRTECQGQHATGVMVALLGLDVGLVGAVAGAPIAVVSRLGLTWAIRGGSWPASDALTLASRARARLTALPTIVVGMTQAFE